MTEPCSNPEPMLSAADVTTDLRFPVEGSYLIVLSDRGRTTIHVGGSIVSLIEGELTVVDLESGVCVVPDRAGRAVYARVPRFILDPWLPDRLTIRGWAVPAETASLSADLLRSLRDEPAVIESAELGGVLGALARVVGAAMLEHDGVEQTGADRQLLAEVLRHLDFAVRRGRVDPVSTARRFGISVRKLHLLFEQECLTFSQTVMQTRLRWCSLVLRSQPATPLSALAARWGFADSSHLSRNLRRQPDRSPVEQRVR